MTEVVNSLEGNQTDKAPSVYVVKNALNTINNDISTLDNTVNNKLDKSKITRGTSNPSGGSDGDIYFKYS